MQDFHKLLVYQRAFDLTPIVFKATAHFPRFLDGKLADPLRRASVSIATNIAEGCGRKGGADFLKFLRQSMGSACEVECCLELSREVGYLAGPETERILGHVMEIKKMLTGLLKSLGYVPED